MNCSCSGRLPDLALDADCAMLNSDGRWPGRLGWAWPGAVARCGLHRL